MSAEIGGGAAKAPALALPRWNSDKNRSQGDSFLRTGGDMFIRVVGQTAPALVSYFLFVISTGSHCAEFLFMARKIYDGR